MVAELESMLAIVDAMTPEEISDATLLADESRRQRIADDVCVDVQLVASTLGQYNEMAKIITNAGRQTDRGYVQLSTRRKRQMQQQRPRDNNTLNRSAVLRAMGWAI